MVNVNAQIPFNLYNQPLSSSASNNSHPGGSRSGSHSRYYNGPPSVHPALTMTQGIPSPSPTRSSSTVSHGWSEADAEGNRSNSALGVRIIRGSSAASGLRRGRTRGRIPGHWSGGLENGASARGTEGETDAEESTVVEAGTETGVGEERQQEHSQSAVRFTFTFIFLSLRTVFFLRLCLL